MQLTWVALLIFVASLFTASTTQQKQLTIIKKVRRHSHAKGGVY